MTGRKRLTEADVGRVFLRVDEHGEPDEYLYLSCLSGGSAPCASFVTFTVADGAVEKVGETGYFNGSWFREVTGFSDSLLSGVLERHRADVKERLRELAQATAAKKKRNARLRERFGKPGNWISLGEGAIEERPSSEYVVWYDPTAVMYSVEVYGPADELLASRHLQCSHRPQFGMDLVDHDLVFGRTGVLRQLIKQVESE